MSVPAVVQALLLRYAERPPLPARSPLWIPPELPKGGAVMRFVRTAAGELPSLSSAELLPHPTVLQVTPSALLLSA